VERRAFKSRHDSENATQHSSLQNYGLDPLQLSLNIINKISQQPQQPIAGSRTRENPKASSTVRGLQRPMTAAARKKADAGRGGLNVLPEELLTADAPLCVGHAMPGKLLVVKKSGKNKVMIKTFVYVVSSPY
jgi:hypothetical protein